MTAYIGVPNVIQIDQPTAELWRYIDFQDGGHSVANQLSVAGLVMDLGW